MAHFRSTAILTPIGRVRLMYVIDDAMVWATTPDTSLGGWDVTRFNEGKFGVEWARQWRAARFPADA